MKSWILIILFLSHLSLRAQQHVDSLKSVLSELSGTAKAEVLNQLSEAFCQSDSLLALKYAHEALSIAQLSKNQKIIAEAYTNQAECLYYFDEFDRALVNYSAALMIYSELDDQERMGETYNSISLVHYFKGEYDWSLENQFKALKYLENSTDRHELAHVYSNIGMVYSRMSQDRMAISNYKKAATINREMDDLYSVAVNHNGMGVAYYNLGILDSAKINYSFALFIFRQLSDQKREAIALNNIANIYVDEGDSLLKALDYYQRAITVFDQLNDLRNKTFVIEGLGCVYRSLGRYEEALKTFKEGLSLAQIHKFGYYIQQLYYKDISATNELLGRGEEAFTAFKSYKLYEDSLYQEERMRQLAELEKKYESEKKEAKISKLNADNEIANLQIQKNTVLRRSGIVVILLLVIIIIYISIGYYDKRKVNILLSQKNDQIEKQNEELEKLNASKNRFFSIIAHDLKNPFHTAIGYSYLLNKEYDRFTDTDRKKYAGEIYRSTNNIFRLLQNLLDWSRSQTGLSTYEPVTFSFRDLYDNIYSLLKPVAENKKVSLEGSIPDDIQVYADPMMIETILRNLISNAIKFSHEGGRVITEIKSDNKDVIISVKDHGVGMSADELHRLFRIESKMKQKGTNNEEGSGIGLILCKEFVQMNKGTIWAQSKVGKGSLFCFTVPIGKV